MRSLRRLLGKHGLVINLCLVIILCFYVPFQLHKQTTLRPSDAFERRVGNYNRHLSIGNSLKQGALPRIHLRPQASFRQKNFFRYARKNNSKTSTQASKRKPDTLANRKSHQRRVREKHGGIRQKRFVQPTIRPSRKVTINPQNATQVRNDMKPTKSKVKIFDNWRDEKISACGRQVEVHPGHFVSFHSAIFRKNLIWCQNLGGEDISEVIGQSEEKEYCTINKGFFVTSCEKSLRELQLPALHKGHLNEWLDNLTPLTADFQTTHSDFKADFTILIKRYEYVNFYHTMTDFYNAFLVMKFFGKSPNKTTIIFFDAHPKGSLDSVWRTLFGNVIRVSELSNITRFEHIVWGIPGYDSLLSEHFIHPSIPLLEQFRAFFLKQYHVNTTRSLDCNAGLRMVVIFRRDYVAHPRNPAGRVGRKFGNEVELLKAANITGIFSSVVGIQLDKIPMQEQLLTTSNTDILVGMHGAGLTHALFLPPHAGVIELFPKYFPRLLHFINISKWRGLKYLSWKNGKTSNEMKWKRTRIPPSLFRRMLLEMSKKLCGRLFK